jgi:L-alanine-DL-glutamate epimerase-like enolase superfamily enzyme
VTARIACIRTRALAIPFETAYAWRYGAQPGINVVLFEVQTEDGIVGYGEASCDHQAAFEALGRMIADEYFVGRSAGDVEAILGDVWLHGRWRQTRRLTNHILAGLEAACWDAWGKTLGLPASAFFGGRVRDDVHFFGYVRGGTPDELAESAAQLVDAGHHVVYMKVGRADVRQDVDCVRAVREAAGAEPLLRADANEAWDVPTAIDQIRRLEPFDLDWVEQPVSSDDLEALAQVRRAVTTKIAADQAVYTTGELKRLLMLEGADVVVIGHHETGGLWRLRQVAFLSEAFGIPINRHGCFETDVSTLATLQVLACIPNVTLGHQLMHPLAAERITRAADVEPERGRIRVPDLPGLGITLHEDAVEHCAERYARQGPYPPSRSRRYETVTSE